MKKTIILRLLVLFLILMPALILISNNRSFAKSDPVSYTYISIQIKEGDTITDIARKYLDQSGLNLKDYSKEIMRLNRLSSDSIVAGAYLMIPVVA